jgi:hypothetical protein
VKPQTRQTATPEAPTSRMLAQPLVLQYGGLELDVRRRIRRIARARPATVDVMFLVSM